jgi:PEP-CTERM motif
MKAILVKATLIKATLAVGVFLSAANCHAGSVTANLSGVGNDNVVRININDGNATNNFSTYGYAGYVNWTQTPLNNNTSMTNHFSTFCIELTQNVSIGGTYTYQLNTLESAPTPGSTQTGAPGGMGSLRADAIRKLWAGAYSSSMTQTQAAAFQLAIWRLEYDLNSNSTIGSMTDFTQGNFRANGANTAGLTAVTDAKALIKSVMDGSYTNLETDLVALTSDNYQDQITVSDNISITSAPEPASISLALIGGGILLARHLRRRKIAHS